MGRPWNLLSLSERNLMYFTLSVSGGSLSSATAWLSSSLPLPPPRRVQPDGDGVAVEVARGPGVQQVAVVDEQRLGVVVARGQLGQVAQREEGGTLVQDGGPAGPEAGVGPQHGRGAHAVAAD